MQLKNDKGKFLTPSGIWTQSPGTQSQCATNELRWPLIKTKKFDLRILTQKFYSSPKQAQV